MCFAGCVPPFSQREPSGCGRLRLRARKSHSAIHSVFLFGGFGDEFLFMMLMLMLMLMLMFMDVGKRSSLVMMERSALLDSLFLSLSLSLSLSPSIYQSIYLSIYLSLLIYLSIYLCVYYLSLSIYLCVYLSMCLSISLSLYLCICPRTFQHQSTHIGFLGESVSAAPYSSAHHSHPLCLPPRTGRLHSLHRCVRTLQYCSSHFCSKKKPAQLFCLFVYGIRLLSVEKKHANSE